MSSNIPNQVDQIEFYADSSEVQDLWSFKQRSLFVDCAIVSNEETVIKAHKVALASSPFLLPLLQHGGQVTIVAPFPAVILELIVEFIYKKKVQIAVDQKGEFIKAAEYFRIIVIQSPGKVKQAIDSSSSSSSVFCPDKEGETKYSHLVKGCSIKLFDYQLQNNNPTSSKQQANSRSSKRNQQPKKLIPKKRVQRKQQPLAPKIEIADPVARRKHRTLEFMKKLASGLKKDKSFKKL